MHHGHDDDIPMSDAYTPHLQALRAAASRADAWRDARMRDLAEEDDKVATLRAAHQARMATEEDDAQYAPPDPYARDLAKLRKEMGR